MELITNKNELKAYHFLRNALVHSQSEPSVRQLMRHIGVASPRTASILINKLIDKGYFERDEVTKKLRLVAEIPTTRNSVRTVKIPVVGDVAAGIPILAEENIRSHISVDESLLRGRGIYYGLQVHGDSMDLTGIHDGDIAIVKQQDYAEENQLVVALIDDEATVKRLKLQGGKVILMPESSNPSNIPIVLNRDFRVQGVVVTSVAAPIL